MATVKKTGKTLKQEAPAKITGQAASAGNTSSKTNKAGGSGTPNLNATTPDALMNQMMQLYNQGNSYTPQTEQQRRDRATAEYQSYYDQLRLAAQQAQEQSDLALQQQRAGLQDTYDRQRKSTAEQYANAYSQADRQMLSRGMQRSSYGNQTLANINQKGTEAQGELDRLQGEAEGNIDAQRAQLAQQLAAQLQQYDASMASDIMKRMNELEDQDWNRSQQQNQNQMNLLNALMGYSQNQQQFNESVRQYNQQHSGGGGGSYYGGTKTNTGSTGNNTGATTPQLSDNSLLNRLNALIGQNKQSQQAVSSTTYTRPYRK